MESAGSQIEDRLDARTRRARALEPPVHTIKLCPATTKRPTTLRLAIDRSIAELTRTGQDHRPLAFSSVSRTQPALRA